VEKDTTHVALDDSERKIVAGILGREATEPEVQIPNDPRHIRRLFDRLKAEERVQACYEGGGVSGYDLYRQLTALRGACQRIALVLTPRRPGQRTKTDRRDAVMRLRPISRRRSEAGSRGPPSASPMGIPSRTGSRPGSPGSSTSSFPAVEASRMYPVP
jgi:transposase